MRVCASARFLDSPRSRPIEAGQPMRDAPDVLVIGGGSAGSVAATLLADTGHRVLVLERERGRRHAHQVARAEFDQLLFENARAGATLCLAPRLRSIT